MRCELDWHTAAKRMTKVYEAALEAATGHASHRAAVGSQPVSAGVHERH